MDDKISKDFMSHSKNIMETDPDLRKKLEKVMGKVADSLVKKKYVNSEENSEKSSVSRDDESV